MNKLQTEFKETFPVKFEFYGVPRLRAGIAEHFVQLPTADRRLDLALNLLRKSLPQIDQACFESGNLRKEYMLNISGHCFLKQPGNVELKQGDFVLLLSSDAGG